MDKTRKKGLNRAFGLLLSAGLLWLLYHQVMAQLARAGSAARLQDVLRLSHGWLAAALALLPLNVGLEAGRWRLLAGTVQPLSYRQALASYFAGIAASVVTPNRIGEYPGRILYLKRQSTYRLATVAILGATAQMLALFSFGMLGFAHYLGREPALWARAAAVGCAAGLIAVAVFYFRFEALLPRLRRRKWAARFVVYGGAVMRFPPRQSLRVLGLALLRFAVFILQYLLLLKWMAVDVPPVQGFCTAALFFWAMAVLPTVSLAELGLRGEVSLFLFGAFSSNTIGILGATVVLWGINLLLPALAGSLLLLRVRLFGTRPQLVVVASGKSSQPQEQRVLQERA